MVIFRLRQWKVFHSLGLEDLGTQVILQNSSANSLLRRVFAKIQVKRGGFIELVPAILEPGEIVLLKSHIGESASGVEASF